MNNTTNEDTESYVAKQNSSLKSLDQNEFSSKNLVKIDKRSVLIPAFSSEELDNNLETPLKTREPNTSELRPSDKLTSENESNMIITDEAVQQSLNSRPSAPIVAIKPLQSTIKKNRIIISDDLRAQLKHSEGSSTAQKLYMKNKSPRNDSYRQIQTPIKQQSSQSKKNVDLFVTPNRKNYDSNPSHARTFKKLASTKLE